MSATCRTTPDATPTPLRQNRTVCTLSSLLLDICAHAACSNSPPRARSSRDDSTRRRSRTPEQTSRYASRYRSPTLPREHWSPSKRHTRQNQDDDIMMRDSVDEEWIIRRAYDSGRADERRRLHRVLMSALDADAENWKGVTGEELITL